MGIMMSYTMHYIMHFESKVFTTKLLDLREQTHTANGAVHK